MIISRLELLTYGVLQDGLITEAAYNSLSAKEKRAIDQAKWVFAIFDFATNLQYSETEAQKKALSLSKQVESLMAEETLDEDLISLVALIDKVLVNHTEAETDPYKIEILQEVAAQAELIVLDAFSTGILKMASDGIENESDK